MDHLDIYPNLQLFVILNFKHCKLKARQEALCFPIIS
jgi:hypothetical protein